MPKRTNVDRVKLWNYKSIRNCDVALGQVAFLVGPNGSGKSNFLEALRFLSFALDNSLERAIEERSGFQNILHSGVNSQHTFGIELTVRLSDDERAKYSVEIGRDGDHAVVVREECSVVSGVHTQWFTHLLGNVQTSLQVAPSASSDKLYLVNASGLALFEPLYRALRNIVVYNPVPDEIRGFKSKVGYRHLDRKGMALAEQVSKLLSSDRSRFNRVLEYLRRITPNLRDVAVVTADSSFNLRFEFEQGSTSVQLPSQNVSDGTLRALAVLVALFQTSKREPLAVVGLEEPESGLHPAAASVLFDSLMEASEQHQIIVTSHSPDLLDRTDIPEGLVKAVEMVEGQTIIADVDDIGRSAIRERLYTAGELLRMNQLRPEGSHRVDVG